MEAAYLRRIVDGELDELFPDLPAIVVEGPKGTGKTVTAMRRAATVIRLDEPAAVELLAADPDRLDREPEPILLDEWQRFPRSWDLVRRSVDRSNHGGRFLLTGSASPMSAPTHSGAGRIVRLRMRPMSIAERGRVPTTVSLAALLAGESDVGGHTDLGLIDYTDEILRSGFPALRRFSGRALRSQLDGYLARIIDSEFVELGMRVRRPAALHAWLTAYAAATATTANYNAILDAATAGDSDKPARSTTEAYRDALQRLWLIDPVPGWLPADNAFTRLAQAPKHHLADPALAARLLGATEASLLHNGRPAPRHATLLGALFESLVTLSVRVYAQACEATVHHLRNRNGDREIDLIVQGPDRRVVAVEVKLGATVANTDIRHLLWLRERIGDRLAAAIVITTGPTAYRRPDGILIVPAALLGV